MSTVEGGGSIPGKSKLKVPSPGQISIWKGGGYSWVVKIQSAKSWPNFNFQVGGVFSGSQNSKCQVLNKFQFWGGGGYSCVVKTQSPSPGQISIFRGGGGYSWVVKTQSAKSWPNFNFQVGAVFLGSQNSKCQVLAKFQFSGGGCILG